MAEATGHHIELQGLGISLQAAAGETVLATLERYGYRMRRSCRNGVCEICEVVLLSGSVRQRYPQCTLNSDNNLSGTTVKALACTAVPLQDIRVKIDGLRVPGEQLVKRLVCDITAVEPLNHDVYRVRLHLPATNSHAIEFHAGQYLEICLPNGRQVPFSIGSAPDQGRDLELHIRHMAESETSNAVMDHLQNNASVEIELPKGDCYIQAQDLKPDTRVILAAASTGFSQIKSVCEHLLANQYSNPIHIYWGVRAEADLYLAKLPEQWQREHTNVIFHAVVSEPETSPDWQGRTGLLPDAVMEDFDDFDDVEILTSGSPGMVYALLDACEAKGFDGAHMHADVFAYAPRPAKA